MNENNFPVPPKKEEIAKSVEANRNPETVKEDVLSLDEMKEDPEMLWNRLELGDNGYFSEGDLTNAVKKFLIENNLVNKENIEDELIQIKSEIVQTNDDNLDADFIEYKCDAKIFIYSDIGFGGDMNVRNISIFLEYNFMGDNKPNFTKGIFDFR